MSLQGLESRRCQLILRELAIIGQWWHRCGALAKGLLSGGTIIRGACKLWRLDLQSCDVLAFEPPLPVHPWQDKCMPGNREGLGSGRVTAYIYVYILYMYI